MRIWSIHETFEPQVTLTWFLHNTEPSKQHLNIHLRYKYKCLEREQHFKTERRFLQNFYISNPAFSDFATPSLDENIKPFPLQYINQYITVSIFSRYEKKPNKIKYPLPKNMLYQNSLKLIKMFWRRNWECVKFASWSSWQKDGQMDNRTQESELIFSTNFQYSILWIKKAVCFKNIQFNNTNGTQKTTNNFDQVHSLHTKTNIQS